MKIHEYQAKELFARHGIPVPRGSVAATVEEARLAAEALGGRAVVKAQVHAGGRGKAGGVKVVSTPAEAEQAARSLLGRTLITHQTDARGVPVQAVLVEEVADIQRELYLAITIDRSFRGPVMMASASGGMDIEEVAANHPDRIYAEPIEPVLGLMPFQARRLVGKLGLEPSLAQAASRIMSTLHRLFVDNDCSLVEINPLIVTGQGKLVALDAKIELEDDALFRHPELRNLRDRSQEDELEAQATDMDISYVKLDGDVGCLVNGAGLAMATLDTTSAAGAAPANFLDVGGGANEEKVASAVRIILSDPRVNRVLVNIFGGILRCDVAARGIVQAFQQKGSKLPLVVRMLGTNVEEGQVILRDSGLNVTFADTLAEAAQAIKGAI
ncbi:MAG: ADP-forming succinate--CoA ligase subunit beta [Chloroflexota bacterium]